MLSRVAAPHEGGTLRTPCASLRRPLQAQVNLTLADRRDRPCFGHHTAGDELSRPQPSRPRPAAVDEWTPAGHLAGRPPGCSPARPPTLPRAFPDQLATSAILNRLNLKGYVFLVTDW